MSPSRPSTVSPPALIAATCCASLSNRTTSAPARAQRAPNIAPIAPAPITAIRIAGSVDVLEAAGVDQLLEEVRDLEARLDLGVEVGLGGLDRGEPRDGLVDAGVGHHHDAVL